MISMLEPWRIQPALWPPAGLDHLEFELPPGLEAGEPPEARGLSRDQVRLLVQRLSADQLVHARFHEIPAFFQSGDVLVINTSGTLNAALEAIRSDGTTLELHLSTRLPGDLWVIELRRTEGDTNLPFFTAHPGERLNLPGGGWVTLLTPYRADQRPPDQKDSRVRLWIATLHLPLPVDPYLDCYGFPIRYKYVKEGWPLSYYQTVYATEKGSAEMPSAGRAFTPELITSLTAKGVQILPLVLHTGVASLEEHEPPYEEYYRVPPVTARLVNNARGVGSRVVAVGTTVVRALETVSDEQGIVHAGEGWTRLVITPGYRMRSATGLLTGFHEPRSSHLAMLASLAGLDPIHQAYGEAIRSGYLWHEFGDMHLILP